MLRQADRALSDQTQRTFPARVAASQLLTSLVDQETGLRGYALTGDANFLQPYRQGLVDEQAIRAQLERFVRPQDPARLALLTVDAAITAWRDEYASLRLEDVLAGSATTHDPVRPAALRPGAHGQRRARPRAGPRGGRGAARRPTVTASSSSWCSP